MYFFFLIFFFLIKFIVLGGYILKVHGTYVQVELEKREMYSVLQLIAELRARPIFFPKLVDFDGAAGLC